MKTSPQGPSISRLVALLLVLGACALAPAVAFAQGTGKVAGTVVDRKTGRALAFVNVAIPEARTGALSDSKGDFLIDRVPAGTYTVRAQFTGYGAESMAGVTVTAGKVAGFFGGSFANTTYIGAADPNGTKWWQGWTEYNIN